jgi:hypothetical protein
MRTMRIKAAVPAALVLAALNLPPAQAEDPDPTTAASTEAPARGAHPSSATATTGSALTSTGFAQGDVK